MVISKDDLHFWTVSIQFTSLVKLIKFQFKQLQFYSKKMIRFTIFVCLLATATVSGWTTSSAVSSFGGSVLVLHRQSTISPNNNNNNNVRSNDITMKKGKDNVPPAMRAQYAKQKEMVAMRDQMLAASKPGSDGLPVFNLFIRTKKANVRSWFILSLPHHVSWYS